MADHTISRRTFLQASAASAAATQFIGVGKAAGPSKVLELKQGLKQLFIDDRFFDQQQGIALAVNPPTKLPTPVLTKEKPWEKLSIGV